MPRKLTMEEVQKLKQINDCHRIDLPMLKNALFTVEAQHQEIEQLNSTIDKMDACLVRCGKELIVAENKRADMQCEIEQLKKQIAEQSDIINEYRKGV